MKKPPRITFRHMAVSPAIEAYILDEIAALERFYARITSCHVVVDAPQRHHQFGRGFHITINLHLPGAELVVNHEPSLHHAQRQAAATDMKPRLETNPEHKDIYVSLGDAFSAAGRRLEDYARVQRGDTKHHASDLEPP